MIKTLWLGFGLAALVTVTGCGHLSTRSHQQDEHTPIPPSNPQVYTPGEAAALVRKLHEQDSADKFTVTCDGDYNGLYRVRWIDASNSQSGLDYVNDKTGTITVATQTWVQLDDMKDRAYYVVTKDPVQKVGKLLGTVCLACNGPTPMSNTLPSGTRVYKIPGADITEEIAVEISRGHYAKALWYGIDKPPN